MKKIVVIDGQGGKMGKLIVESLKRDMPSHVIYAIGTNTMATAAMMKAGADYGATGENPVIVNSADADIIVGPLGMIIANALLGEITPAMAQAVGSSRARKVLLPVNRCNNTVVGVKDVSFQELVQMSVDLVKQYAQ